MKRLFITLYFAVTIGLLTIGWATEKVWQYLQASTDGDIIALTQLSKTIPPLLEQEKLDAKDVSKLLGLPITILPRGTISFSIEDDSELNQGSPISVYDDKNQMSIILKLSQSQNYVQIGPIRFEQNNNRLKYALLLFSYILLAGIIFLWTRPLWRDLHKLQKTAKMYGKGHFEIENGVKKSSVIWPLASTFNAMANQIARLLDEQKQLTNAVSHDLRTPLSRLKFSIAMQSENPMIQDMHQDVLELESLVDELLKFGRLENQHKELKKDRVNISQLLINLTEKLQRGIQDDTKLNLTLDEELTCYCDGHLIERAIQNLITNAIRYGDSIVNISMYSVKNAIVITVEDDGDGIAEADREKVFNAFTRLDKSRNKSSGGFGLGLAIVQRICQWHLGTCIVEDAAIGGAKFVITLPKSETEF